MTAPGGRGRDLARSRRLRGALERRLDRAEWPAWVKDPGGRYLAANRVLARHLGTEREALIGRLDQAFWPTGVAGRFRVDDHAALARGRAVAVPEYGPDGASFLVTLKLPLRRSDGAPVATVGFFAPAVPASWARSARRLYGKFLELLGEAPLDLGLHGARDGFDPTFTRRCPLRSPDVPDWLLATRERLVSGFSRSWTVKGLAREARVHPGHLGRAFRRAFGSGVHGFVRRRRVDWACVQLRTTDRSAGEIGLAAGFCDQSHFIREFRRVEGVTPGRYRRQVAGPRDGRTVGECPARGSRPA